MSWGHFIKPRSVHLMSLFVRWQGHAGLGLAQLPLSTGPCWEVLVGAVASLSGLSGLPVAAFQACVPGGLQFKAGREEKRER